MGESERSDPKSSNLKIGYPSEGRTFPSILIPQEGLECSLQQPVRLNLDCQRLSRELCDQCSMMEFVPPEHKSAQFPCHHIPLNTAGESIASLQENGNGNCIEWLICDWLRRLPTNKKSLAWESGLMTMFLQKINSKEES